MSAAETSDAGLTTKLRDTGDLEALKVLLLRHGPMIGAFLGRLYGCDPTPMLPKVFDRLLDRSYSIRDVEAFQLWAIGVVASMWREEPRLPQADDPIAFRVISRIAPSLRPVFVLVHYFKLSINDISLALRIPRGTTITRLNDAFASVVAQIAPVAPPPLPREIAKPAAEESISEALQVIEEAEEVIAAEEAIAAEGAKETEATEATEHNKETDAAPPKESEEAQAAEPSLPEAQASEPQEPPIKGTPTDTPLAPLIPKLSDAIKASEEPR